MYLWAHDTPQSTIAHETDIQCRETIVDWCNFCRDVCEEWVENNGEEIGGITDRNEPIVVEIDETEYFHRKYHRGQWRDGHWVFGGIERETAGFFLAEVPDRTAATLTREIEKRILPGSHSVSDGLASYAQIDRIRGGIYTHAVVVHQDNFIDLAEPDTHTHKTWRTCGCGPSEKFVDSLARAGTSSKMPFLSTSVFLLDKQKNSYLRK